MHVFTHRHGEAGEVPIQETRGLVMNWGWRYDLLIWFADTLFFRGKLRALRYKTIDLAQLQPGDAVLDVGCGTGTVALLAKERVGEAGRVCGIDPGPRQIARARLKGTRQGLPIDFQVGVIEQIPYPDQSFDVVVSTLMMHHLPDDLKRAGLAEIHRVLKPEGRLVIVDFRRKEAPQSQPAQLGAGELGQQDLPALLGEAGFLQIESGEIPFPHLMGLEGIGFVRARRDASR